MSDQSPRPIVSAIPLLVLIALLVFVIAVFGSDSLNGGSQVALLLAMAACVTISMTVYRMSWKLFERQIMKTIGDVSITLVILLTVGMLSGSWMVSGIVPTLIYYGVQIISPQFFLFTSCIICALVSVLSGSSWTTIATIGVAFIGIGHALGISEAWTAGAIISGAYFGDKMSPLSDTTILASSSVRVDIFEHIRYMVLTTTPSILITLVIFLVAGLGHGSEDALHIEQYVDGLNSTFNISLWTLLVPLITGILIARKVPSLVVLFVSSIIAGITAIILQPHILCQIADDPTLSTPAAIFKGLAITYYGSTAVQTGFDALNDLVSTGGMAGMLIPFGSSCVLCASVRSWWLVVCLEASRMLSSSGYARGRAWFPLLLEQVFSSISQLVTNLSALFSQPICSAIFIRKRAMKDVC